ncbi:Serine/threonine-protein phosphatase 2A regulatory subunit B'' subunit gamma [Intoshia linei]|uniref:Serine/threonine-protein phosphatase 2A regulatory subunit B'' subunit gamma n=1 Tax=Intoshia linei TaxID=1819745 RepID=A0A177B212_9BILA|nr:Serine/threonine-protein phosphatase 2A regulatory subunit B'' subunit gamma [Intoshia linei]
MSKYTNILNKLKFLNENASNVECEKNGEDLYQNEKKQERINFFQKIKFDNIIQKKFNCEYRDLFYKKISRISTEKKLKLSKICEDCELAKQEYLTFNEFIKFKHMLGSNFRFMFSSHTFAFLSKNDPKYRIRTDQLFEMITKSLWIVNTRIEMLLYDETGEGFLNFNNFVSYLRNMVNKFHKSNVVDDNFIDYYIVSITRLFGFFLDYSNSGKFVITDILATGFIEELLELQNELTQSETSTNIFYVDSIIRFYGVFINTDKDGDGLLSCDELLANNSKHITPHIIKRIFETMCTHNGKLDYNGYLNLMYAFMFMEQPSSISYFFKLLDLNEKNCLDVSDITFFVDSMYQVFNMRDGIEENYNSFIDEMFDMIQSKDPYKITRTELLQSSCAAEFLKLIVDFSYAATYLFVDQSLADEFLVIIDTRI